MTARLDLTQADPRAYKAMMGLQTYVNESGLEPALLGLVELRSSQINGCAYCIDMHSKDARARVRPSSASTRSTRGAKQRFTANANVLRWPGLKP